MKKFFTLAALFTSSLAGAVDSADSENKYYVGLNVGGGYVRGGYVDDKYNGGLSVRPSFLIGYNDRKNSKLELEINSDIHTLENIRARFLINYRYYPDFLDIDPVTMYFSGGLGGYFHYLHINKSDSTAQSTQDEHTNANNEPSDSLARKILSHVPYKLEFGVDYAFTPQIIFALGFTTGGRFDMSVIEGITEIGIRYNF
ncbi:hypothetical protein [Wolbachia endosymbiont of Folsomia candida]|uniref:hypothetical protein n=1 Tax=Wolbachia endosymbiont of Folsomia candida TaxID=169402 RepID=UPI000B290129|nr:hypothetical protein [Wolbachia endosymbiont of Folsomia candida]APR98212.1 hypothetical protein ASM33_02785 [Wolbachia endosymbiont of Folsomia candida]